MRTIDDEIYDWLAFRDLDVDKILYYVRNKHQNAHPHATRRDVIDALHRLPVNFKE